MLGNPVDLAIIENGTSGIRLHSPSTISFPSGSYILNIHTDDGLYHRKLVIN
jgi:hypothetical protein